MMKKTLPRQHFDVNKKQQLSKTTKDNYDYYYHESKKYVTEL